ncbi:S49 family peptidase, partial [Nostoc sp. CHAB 5834]|nr:S49 family peptidase [Nostoc sp. CHAB 5834]
ESGRETQAQLLSDIHEHFKDVVKQGRGDRLKADTPGLFSGTVWTGSDAVKLGLADKLGDTRSAVKENFGVEKVREYAAEKPLLQSLIGGLGVAIGTGIGNAVSSQVTPVVHAPLLKQ